MATDLYSSFDEQYMNINTKLKKRFMRKPNISEATSEFNALAVQCELAEQPMFAGHCYIGSAKCEAAMGNSAGEAECLLAAARQFLKAETKMCSLKCYSPTRENLEAAIGCYLQTLDKYPNQWSLRTSVLMQLANSLSILGHKLEAITYYEQAMDNINENNALKLKCLCCLLDLNILTGRHSIALNTANTIIDSGIHIPESTLTDVQITRILLNFLVESPEDQQPESLKTLMTNLKNDNFEDLPFSIDVSLKLQSVQISLLLGDLESLVQVSGEKLFCLTQQDLLLTLIRDMEGKM